MVAIMFGADNGFFYVCRVMHFSRPFSVFLIYHKQTAEFLNTFDNENVYYDQDHSSLFKATYKFAVMDCDAVYSTLIKKLDTLYGKHTSGSHSQGYINTTYDDVTEWSVWTGENNTGIVLYQTYQKNADGSRSSGDLYLRYGKTNSVDLMLALEKAISREQLEAAMTDTDGL